MIKGAISHIPPAAVQGHTRTIEMRTAMRVVSHTAVATIVASLAMALFAQVSAQRFFDASLWLAYQITDDATWVARWAYACQGMLNALVIAPLSIAVYALLGKVTRRSSVGVCEHCGYDIRASAERCPECGLAVPGR